MTGPARRDDEDLDGPAEGSANLRYPPQPPIPEPGSETPRPGRPRDPTLDAMGIAFGPELATERARNNRAAAVLAIAAIMEAQRADPAALRWLFDPSEAERDGYAPRWSVLAELGRVSREHGPAQAVARARTLDPEASARAQVAHLRRLRRGLPPLTADGLIEVMRRALNEHLGTRALGEDWREVAAHALRVLALSVRAADDGDENAPRKSALSVGAAEAEAQGGRSRNSARPSGATERGRR